MKDKRARTKDDFEEVAAINKKRRVMLFLAAVAREEAFPKRIVAVLEEEIMRITQLLHARTDAYSKGWTEEEMLADMPGLALENL